MYFLLKINFKQCVLIMADHPPHLTQIMSSLSLSLENKEAKETKNQNKKIENKLKAEEIKIIK